MHYGPVFTDVEWLEFPKAFGDCLARSFLKNFRILVVETGLEVEDYWVFASNLVEKHMPKPPKKTPISGFVLLPDWQWNLHIISLSNQIACNLKNTHQFIEHTGENEGEVVHELDNRLFDLIKIASKDFLSQNSGLADASTPSADAA